MGEIIAMSLREFARYKRSLQAKAAPARAAPPPTPAVLGADLGKKLHLRRRKYKYVSVPQTA